MQCQSIAETLRVHSSRTSSDNMFSRAIWKLEVPKDRLVSLIDRMDADEDGYISFREVIDLLRDYAVKLKRSMRCAKKRR